MNDKKIGILAGMGPRSTAPFLEMVLDECEKKYQAKYDDEFPAMMIYSLPAPFYMDKPMDQFKLEAIVCEGAKRLAATGVDFIAIPCNSIHAFFDRIADSVQVPVLNIVEETIKRLPKKTKNIAIIATQMTMNSRVYQNALIAHGFEIVDMLHLQPDVDRLISYAKGKNQESRSLLKSMMEQCKMLGADAVIVACTDLTYLIMESFDLPMIDSSRALAEAAVWYYKGL